MKKLIYLQFILFCILLGAAQTVKADAVLRIASSVTDVNGGSLLANDIIEYTFVVTNIGDASATVAAFNNTMPTGTTYVASSMSIDGVAKTDGILDDQADYIGLGSKATFRLGTGANSATGGTIAVGASTTFKFRTRINAGTAAGTAITNQGTMNYNVLLNINSDADLNTPGEQANILYVNLPAPSIVITQTVSPTGNQSPGTDLLMTTTYTNSGGAQAQNFRLVEPIPANTDFKLSSAAANLGTTGLTVTMQYSNDSGTTFTYTPVSAGGGARSGYDRNVTHVRFLFTGLLSKTAPNNTGTVSFSSQIR